MRIASALETKKKEKGKGDGEGQGEGEEKEGEGREGEKEHVTDKCSLSEMCVLCLLPPQHGCALHIINSSQLHP